MDGPATITIKTDINVSGTLTAKPITEKIDLPVDAFGANGGTVPVNEKATPISVMNAEPGRSLVFLLIRPQLPDKAKTPFKDGGTITYSTSATEVEKLRKPLRGNHVFFNGQTEWLTAPHEAGGEAKPLGTLYFWNNFEPVFKAGATDPEKAAATKALAVQIDVLVGYDSEP